MLLHVCMCVCIREREGRIYTIAALSGYSREVSRVVCDTCVYIRGYRIAVVAYLVEEHIGSLTVAVTCCPPAQSNRVVVHEKEKGAEVNFLFYIHSD